MNLVTRSQSGLRPPTYEGNQINARPDGTVIHWEGPGMGDYSHSQCAGKVRGIQRFHQVTRGWSDIAYNFIVCRHGYVFEGRGLYKGSGANGTSDANRRYYAVCAMMGEGDRITPELMAGLKDAVALCRTRAKATILGHRNIVATTCPGSLYAKLDELRTVPARVVEKVKKVSRSAVKKVTRAALVVDGDLGPKTIRQWQKVMGTVQDGVISKPSLLVRVVQRRVGVEDDGYLGPITWRAIQRRLGVRADGIPGPITIKALQRRLNTGKF